MLKKQILTHIYDKKVFVMENIVESILKKIIIENEYTEGGGRKLSKKTIDYINGETDKLARELYGNKYGKDDKTMQGYFPDNKRKIKNDVDIKGGIFSLGNDKLSDDTLIINFNSALGCPSINDCPITQLACYAVAGENRLPDTKKKHILVQKLVNAARNNNMLEGIFRIAELYIIAAKETPRPIRYIRYNEVGDFVDQKMLELAAKFSRMVKDKYGIISMAYTSKKGIDPSAEIDGEPIDMIIAINRSRNDIPKSPNALNRKFFGIPMPRNGFSVNPNVNLDNAYADVDEVTDNELNKLKVTMPINGSNGYPSVPTLHYGKWSGGEGYYYVCPCSFWKYNKDKAEKEFLVAHGIMTDDEEMPQNSAQRRAFNKRIPKKLKDELKRILKKIKSPCGIKCAVCHDMDGGVTDDGKTNVKDYSILTATHGATASNYNSEYATAKRNGDDSVKYSEDNPHGHFRKYKLKYSKSDAPIRDDFMSTADDKSEVEKQKEDFKESYKRLFGEIL